MTIQFMEPFGRAWSRMKAALFTPFDIHKWLVVGLSAFLASLWESHNWGGGARVRENRDFGEFVHFPQAAWAWLTGHPLYAALILFGLIVVIAFVVAVTWAGSRGIFMFLDNVVRDSADIARPWREYRKEGNSLFVWRLVFGLVTFGIFGLILALVFVQGAALYDRGTDLTVEAGAMLFPLIGLGLLVLAIILVLGYIVLFLKDFVAPLMYRNRVSCAEAWRQFLAVFKTAPLHFTGYGIIIFFLMIAFGIAVVAAGLATCCIGFVVLLFPYIGTVATLPFWYTYRAYSLEFLAQFGPEYDLLKRPGEGQAAAPVAPAL